MYPGLVDLCTELRVRAASGEGLISYQCRRSFTKRLQPSSGGTVEEDADPGAAAAAPHGMLL